MIQRDDSVYRLVQFSHLHLAAERILLAALKTKFERVQPEK